MDVRVVVGIVVLVGLVPLRLFAARRVAARQGQFVWLMYLPTLLVGGMMLWASTVVFAGSPLVGGLTALAALIYLAVLGRFLVRTSRSVSSASPQDDLGSAITEPLVDYMSTMVGLGLIGGLVAVVGLIIWGVIQAAR
jgi:hypothetical protein